MIEDLAVDRPWLMLGDCLERMTEIPDDSVDMICADLPYGTTNCPWDSIIPLDPLWNHYKRVIKRSGAVILTASQPFTSVLVVSNLAWYRHDLVWAKNRPTGHLNANRAPLRAHESALVFSPGKMTYNPKKTDGYKPVSSFYTRNSGSCFRSATKNTEGGGQTDRYPTSVLKFSSVSNIGKSRLHPSQKPDDLFQWVVETYSNVGEVVLDNCFGSATTGVACVNTGRRFIGIEKDPNYFELGRRRLTDAIAEAFQPAIPGGLSDSLAV